MERPLLVLAALAIAIAGCTSTPQQTTDPESTTTTSYGGESYAGTVDAPEFPEGLDWINVARPLRLDDLRGKVVLLDFWTYGCINCIHIIPDLERLEEEYPDELVVIGVHSAKFPNEAETGNLEDIVQRYGIRHPVVNDEDFAIWNAWGANAWPTVAIIDPTGRAVGIRAGEGVYDAVEPVIAGLVAEFSAMQAIDATPIDLDLEADRAPDRPLDYPGKVLARDGRLWIADTGHNRIVEADPDTGEVLAVYGNGERGRADGAALEATFNAPQGLATDGASLWVADTNNHLIREIDLATGEVSTIVGTGEQGWPPSAGASLEVALSNPWGLEFGHGFLYIANAGTHQIWAADLANGWASPLIGSAREGTLNGDFETSELAQPSGVTLTADNLLVFADSESSSIRYGDLLAGETVLLVGGDATLFEFGDVDGTRNEARLQHPLGVAADGDTIYVADTYNSKVKRADLTTSSIEGWLGAEAGWRDGSDPLFNEPGGLSVDDGRLFVADTNNHVIRVIDMATGDTTTLVLKGIEGFEPQSEFSGDVVTLPGTSASAGSASLVLDMVLPPGYKVNEDAPSTIELTSGSSILRFDQGSPVDLTGTSLPAMIPLTLLEGSGTAVFDVNLVFCQESAQSLCLIERVRFEQPLDVGPPGSSTLLVLPRTVTTP